VRKGVSMMRPQREVCSGGERTRHPALCRTDQGVGLSNSVSPWGRGRDRSANGGVGVGTVPPRLASRRRQMLDRVLHIAKRPAEEQQARG
jgi:hypothetical protein